MMFKVETSTLGEAGALGDGTILTKIRTGERGAL
jgi:hypothetical protein